MPDYKELYLTMIRETEKAIQILTYAQQKCEDLYLNDLEPRKLIPFYDENSKKEKPK